MPRWKLTGDCYLAPVGEAPRVCREGETISFDGVPALCMEPADAEARAVLEDYEQQRGTKGRHPHGHTVWTGRG
jgi:hypothetical protein